MFQQLSSSPSMKKVYFVVGLCGVLFLIFTTTNMKRDKTVDSNANHLFESNPNKQSTFETLLEKIGAIENGITTKDDFNSQINKVNSRLSRLQEVLRNQTQLIQSMEFNEDEDMSEQYEEEEEIDEEEIIPIVMITCNRANYLQQSMNSLFTQRPSKAKFPIFLSIDCDDAATTELINKQFARDVVILRQPDRSKHVGGKDGVPPGDNPLYFDIARHFEFVMSTIFDDYDFKQLVIVEDDCEVAPDFFSYFAATLPLLRHDSTLYCVSAFNDNGQKNHVKNPQTLERSDFHSGIGWMMTKSLWEEYRDIFPDGHWDDWMRMDKQRKGRQCIRPEVCRTYNFGKKGSSNGMWWEEYLASIKLNDEYVDFEKADLSYLDKATYDSAFIRRVSSAKEALLSDDLRDAEGDHRIMYHTHQDYEAIAKKYHLMPDFWFGMPRVSYRGVVWVNLGKGMLYVVPSAFPLQDQPA